MHLYVAPLLLSLLFASAAHAQYVGVTVEVFDGAQGIFTYNRACHAAHPGSRMCTSEEMVNTVNPPVVGSAGELAWVKPAPQPYGNSFDALDASSIPMAMSEYTCEAWSTTNAAGFVVKLEDGMFEVQSCQFPSRVTCCIPVPEPSASLTIPSGVGMLFVLAKLRGISLIQ